MKVTVICLGSVKEKYLKDAITDYSKRLSRYVVLNIIELKDEPIYANTDTSTILNKEKDKILKVIDQKGYIVCLDILGKSFTSEGFSMFFDEVYTYYNDHIIFIIGGSLGLSEDILKLANLRLSFSKFTFPHQLMRVILLEQIYRSFKIINNETYHK